MEGTANKPSTIFGGINPQHIYLLASFRVRGMFASKKFWLVFLALAGFCFIVWVGVIQQLKSEIQKKGVTAKERAHYMASMVVNDFLKDGASDNTDVFWNKKQLTYLAMEKPLFLSFAIFAILYGSVAVVCLSASGQIVKDIENKGLRFLLLRTERINILLGRFFGAWVSCALGVLAIIASITIYLQINLPSTYKAESLWSWTLLGWSLISIFIMPIVAACAWVSSWRSRTRWTFFICLLVVVATFFMLISLVTYLGFRGIISDDLGLWILRLSPIAWAHELFSVETLVRLRTILVMLAFSILFLIIAHWRFGKRDL